MSKVPCQVASPLGLDLGHWAWDLGPIPVGWIVAIGVLSFVGSLGLAAIVVVQMPEDYFSGARPPRRAGALRMLGFVAKNLAGAALVALGIVLAIPGVPGQGLLVILSGLVLMNFPGKRRLERWALKHGRVLRSLNTLRARFGRAPFRPPQ